MLSDRHHRVISYLRISVTDRCNFRCVYCLPAEGVQWLPREDILSFEEITRVAAVGATLGLKKIRLTGGEPTLRRELPALVAMLRGISGIEEIAMTTNASRLEEMARPLREAGLDRVNISLDSLQPERANALARRDVSQIAQRGIEAAHRCGLPMKFNAVVMRGVNEDELVQLARFAHERNSTMRFIEAMPMGENSHNARDAFVATEEMKARLNREFDLVPESETDDAARGWICRRTGVRVAFISSISESFCDTCNRMRLTAEGGLRPCLHQNAEVDVRAITRGDSEDMDDQLRAAFFQAADLKWAGHRINDFIPLHSSKDMISVGG